MDSQKELIDQEAYDYVGEAELSPPPSPPPPHHHRRLRCHPHRPCHRPYQRDATPPNPAPSAPTSSPVNPAPSPHSLPAVDPYQWYPTPPTPASSPPCRHQSVLTSGIRHCQPQHPCRYQSVQHPHPVVVRSQTLPGVSDTANPAPPHPLVACSRSLAAGSDTANPSTLPLPSSPPSRSLPVVSNTANPSTFNPLITTGHSSTRDPETAAETEANGGNYHHGGNILCRLSYLFCRYMCVNFLLSYIEFEL
ncbi:vegetative cell wall protein gp1-like [Arachis ipaensis]|uniref:vegetative cell wall protein gp1-like n=1 Tax=Arachis ipaensis TaxID=130454 RepID=UPI000A2B427A|nr:vegetative cell wall protein gp1-like [Arachis ipaensis]